MTEKYKYVTVLVIWKRVTRGRRNTTIIILGSLARFAKIRKKFYQWALAQTPGLLTRGCARARGGRRDGRSFYFPSISFLSAFPSAFPLILKQKRSLARAVSKRGGGVSGRAARFRRGTNRRTRESGG